MNTHTATETLRFIWPKGYKPDPATVARLDAVIDSMTPEEASPTMQRLLRHYIRGEYKKVVWIFRLMCEEDQQQFLRALDNAEEDSLISN